MNTKYLSIAALILGVIGLIISLGHRVNGESILIAGAILIAAGIIALAIVEKRKEN